jgi:hypothetical protein
MYIGSSFLQYIEALVHENKTLKIFLFWKKQKPVSLTSIRLVLDSASVHGHFIQTQGWSPFLTSPLGANLWPPEVKLFPRGEICPLGVKLSNGGEILCSPSILLNMFVCSRECSPLGVNEGVNISPRGQSSPLGAKFTPRGEVHRGSQGWS